MIPPLGVTFEAVIHLISDSRANEAHCGVTLGVNRIPTKKDVDRMVAQAIAAANEASGAGDYRLVTIADRHIPPGHGLADWVVDPANAEADPDQLDMFSPTEGEA